MANVRSLQKSFSGGEISPKMLGRIDDPKYQNGAAAVRNFVVVPQGPVENRAGLAFVRAAKSNATKARLMPFTYSTTQTMVLEMGVGYIRFHTAGATLLAGSPAAYSGAVTYAIGDLVSSGGINYYCILATTGNAPPNATYWYSLPSAAYEIPSPYAEADLFDIHYVQSGDILTLVHPTYAPRELRRLSATSWTLTVIPFTPSISAPTGVNAANTSGERVNIQSISTANPGVIICVSNHGLAVGDVLFIADIGGMTEFSTGFYVLNTTTAADRMTVKSYVGGAPLDTTAFTAYTSGGYLQYVEKATGYDNTYVVTAIGTNGLDESIASSQASTINNLYVLGAKNTITWSAVTGAVQYKVYKLQSGLFGFIGRSQTTTFIDDNISPDMGENPPTFETVFNVAGAYPTAVSYFEQRRCFAGTTVEPQRIWMTRSGTESDMSYAIPIKDSDRVSFKVAAREANSIRHIVPLTQMLLMTSAAEWRVTSVNSDAITPTSISVRPQSYIGASNVQPTVINNSIVFGAARGGHINELGYNWQTQGFMTGDLSLRATHLFDTYDVTELAYSKSPYPIIWMISSSGNLLGLTYIPEQQISAWHRHDTDGIFESCAVVAEGKEDALYVVVKRTVNSVVVRYVERMQTRVFTALEDAFFVDSGLTYNGTNVGATTMTLSGGTTWAPSETLTCTASVGTFLFPVSTDLGDAIVFTSAGLEYTFTIAATSSTTVATGRVDKTVPVALRNVATTTWAFARDGFTGLSHLEGKTVSILADGGVHPQRVVTSGAVTLTSPAVKIAVGLPYQSDLQTLPWSAAVDNGMGQGRYKNVNKAWLRVFQSSGIFMGPDADHLVEAKQRTTEPYGTPPALKTQEIQLVLTPSWADSGQVYVRQSDPLPLTVVALTVEVSLGG